MLVAVVATACSGEIRDEGATDAAVADAARDAAVAPADAAPPGMLLGAFQLTYYWVTSEDDYPGTKDTAIYDPACSVLATVTSEFASSLALEGTGRLSDGRVLNYDGSCGCPRSPCFFEVDEEHPWGVGVQNRPLIPFRSIAVDSDVIAYGDRIYVVELDGVAMPGESPWGDFVHDGCVTADDTGGAIIGMHIDFFAALRDHYYDLDGRLGLATATLHDGGARCP